MSGKATTTAGLLARLAGGDRRSIGRAEEVVDVVLAGPERFQELFEGLRHADPVVRMRAADAVEKVTAVRPDLLAPFKNDLLGDIAADRQQEVRWHLAQMLPRLPLTAAERATAAAILYGYLADPSRIVQVNALQALADLAQTDPALRPEVRHRLIAAASSRSPAVRSRAQKLLSAWPE